MGIGKAQRRRAKNAAEANVSLHKAARGKGTVHMPLPAAPTKDDYTDKMPRSLRMMLALKGFAEQQPAKRRKLDEQASQQQKQQPGDHNSGKHGASQQDAQQQTQQQQSSTKQPKQQQQQAVDTGPAWQQPKRLKQKKKEYLNAKKLKKKGKGRVAAADMELQSDRPAFGEVVHAPPEVALKSKHWAANSSGKQQQQRQQQQAHTNSKKHKQQHQHTKQRAPKRQQDDELLEMREQLIESYRAGRPAPQEGQATLQSLKALVKKQQL